MLLLQSDGAGDHGDLTALTAAVVREGLLIRL